jgi:hypothetical protein
MLSYAVIETDIAVRIGIHDNALAFVEVRRNLKSQVQFPKHTVDVGFALRGCACQDALERLRLGAP